MDQKHQAIKLLKRRLGCTDRTAEILYGQAAKEAREFCLEVTTAASAIADRQLSVNGERENLKTHVVYIPCPFCRRIIPETLSRCSGCGRIINHYIRSDITEDAAVQMVKDGYCPFNDCPYLDTAVTCMDCMTRYLKKLHGYE